MNNDITKSEIEISSDKITIIRYNPKVTDLQELQEALSNLDMPYMHTIIIPNDMEITQMTAKEAEELISELQAILKEICHSKKNPLDKQKEV